MWSACGAKKATTSTTEEASKVLPEKYANVSDEDLMSGQELYAQHCGNCHALKKEDSHSMEEWEAIVPKMVVKANKKYPDSVQAEDEQLILQYLVVTSFQ